MSNIIVGVVLIVLAIARFYGTDIGTVIASNWGLNAVPMEAVYTEYLVDGIFNSMLMLGGIVCLGLGLHRVERSK